MPVNKFLLKQAKLSVKQAFMPPEAGGGAPPMDPSMMGGAPPGAIPPGGAPPMDPSMMGGAPPGAMPPGAMPPSGAPPMDPSMMGGAPPMDPAAAAVTGGDPAEQIRSVVQEELQKALSGAKGVNKGVKKNDGQNTEMFMRRIQKLLTHLYSSLGLNLPPDILDDTPSPDSDPATKSQAGAPDQAAPAGPSGPAKLASHEDVAEKAAGVMYLLRKIKNDR